MILVFDFSEVVWLHRVSLVHQKDCDLGLRFLGGGMAASSISSPLDAMVAIMVHYESVHLAVDAGVVAGVGSS